MNRQTVLKTGEAPGAAGLVFIPVKEGTPRPMFSAATTQTRGCSHWVTEQSSCWHRMQDDCSFLGTSKLSGGMALLAMG